MPSLALLMQASVETVRHHSVKAKQQLQDKKAELDRSRREVHFLARKLGQKEVGMSSPA